jgi:RND family efflux transporter MFP subunit
MNRLKTQLTVLSVAACIASSGSSANDALSERFDCLIEPLMVIEVGSPVQGVIKSIAVERSRLVEKGDVLAELESEVELASLAQARARAQMDGEIEARNADLDLALQSKARIDELSERKMVSSQQKDEADAEVQVAKMAVQQAIERKQLAEFEYRWAKQVVKRRTIRSPISGVVVELRAFPGEFVYENPIMTIAQINPLRVEDILPVELFGKLKEGMRAEVFPEVAAGNMFDAEVSVVDRLIDTGSSTFGARLELLNAEHQIPGGQRCELAFLADDDNTNTEQVAARGPVATP